VGCDTPRASSKERRDRLLVSAAHHFSLSLRNQEIVLRDNVSLIFISHPSLAGGKQYKEVHSLVVYYSDCLVVSELDALMMTTRYTTKWGNCQVGSLHPWFSFFGILYCAAEQKEGYFFV
jgi:hypothetical protein